MILTLGPLIEVLDKEAIEMRYPVVLHKESATDYGVIVPDVPGCHSAGSTIDEALEMAKEAIEGHIELLFEHGDSIPSPLSVEEHINNPDYSDGTWAYVDVDIVELLGKTERYNITMPALLVKRLDDYLDTHPTLFRSRSDFFAKMAMKAIEENRNDETSL